MTLIIKKPWLSWNFVIEDAAGHNLAEARLSGWLARGALTVGGIRHSIVGDAGFVLTTAGAGVKIAHAKEGLLFRDFTFDIEGHAYVVQCWSPLRRTINVHRDDQVICSLPRMTRLTRNTSVDLPADVPIVLASFLVWLAVLISAEGYAG